MEPFVITIAVLILIIMSLSGYIISLHKKDTGLVVKCKISRCTHNNYDRCVDGKVTLDILDDIPSCNYIESIAGKI